MLQTYAGGLTLDSDTNLLRLGAAIGRGVFHDLQSARQAPASQTSSTTEGIGDMTNPDIAEHEYEDKLATIRQQIAEAQGKGDSRRANRLKKTPERNQQHRLYRHCAEQPKPGQ